MFIKNLTKREKKVFNIAGAIIAGVLFYIMIIEPIWKKWKILDDRINTAELKLQKNLKILAQKDMIAKLYDKYAENIKMKGSVEEETASILKEIENIARSSNTYIADIKPQKVQEMEFYKEYYVELEAEGDISAIARFIYDLQNSKQILKVRYLKLNPKDETADLLKGYMIISKILIP